MVWRLAAAAAVVALGLAAGPAAADVITVINASGSGSCTSSGCNNTNTGVIATPTTQNIGGTDTAYGWWSFSIPSLPAGATITGATFSLWNNGDKDKANSPGVEFYMPSGITFSALADQSSLLSSVLIPPANGTNGPTGYVTFSPVFSFTPIVNAEGGTFLFGANPSGVNAANQEETFFNGFPVGQSGAFLTLQYAVPEPSTWALTILGVGMVGAALRRRRRMAGAPA